MCITVVREQVPRGGRRLRSGRIALDQPSCRVALFGRRALEAFFVVRRRWETFVQSARQAEEYVRSALLQRQSFWDHKDRGYALP